MCVFIYIYIYIYIYMYVYVCLFPFVYIYRESDRDRDIYSPTPVGLSSPANEVIVMPLAFITSLFVYMN